MFVCVGLLRLHWGYFLLYYCTAIHTMYALCTRTSSPNPEQNGTLNGSAPDNISQPASAHPTSHRLILDITVAGGRTTENLLHGVRHSAGHELPL